MQLWLVAVFCARYQSLRADWYKPFGNVPCILCRAVGRGTFIRNAEMPNAQPLISLDVECGLVRDFHCNVANNFRLHPALCEVSRVAILE